MNMNHLKKTYLLYLLFIVILTNNACATKELHASGTIPYETNKAVNVNFEQDDQYCFNKPTASERSMAESETGYYFFDGMADCFLYYIDKSTINPIVLCNKPDCLHFNEPDPEKVANCNAFFGSVNANLMYFNSNLYVIDTSERYTNSGSDFYQISLDGTMRKKIYTFKETIYYMIIHRGYIYYVTKDMGTIQDKNDSNTTVKLLRLSLMNTSQGPELLYEYKGIYANIAGLIGYDDGIFFSCYSYQDIEMRNNSGILMRYDISNGNISEILKDSERVTICGNMFVYSWDGNYYRCRMDGSDKKKLELDTEIIYSDDKFIIGDTLLSKLKQEKDEKGDLVKREIHIFDLNGNKLATFDIDSFGISEIYGSDSNYIFIKDSGSRSNKFGKIAALYVIDKSSISQDAKMKKIFEFVPEVEYKGVIITGQS